MVKQFVEAWEKNKEELRAVINREETYQHFDTENILVIDDYDGEQRIDELMTLCLHLLQRLKFMNEEE